MPSLAVCLALANADVAQARIQVDILSAQDKTAVVRVVGRIQEGEDEQLKQELLTLQQAGYRLKLNAIVLDSPGGSGSTADAMGRLIRHNKLNTYVAPKSRCASACVSVLSGGLVRMAYGQIKVHRTTYGDGVTPDQIERVMQASDEKEMQFTKEMGLSPLLTDAVMTTPSWSIRILDDKEKRRWGVHATDRLYEEMWFRTTASQTRYPIEVIRMFFYRHYAKCEAQQKRFEATLWDCVRQEIY
jgi:hypothetical protein